MTPFDFWARCLAAYGFLTLALIDLAADEYGPAIRPRTGNG